MSDLPSKEEIEAILKEVKDPETELSVLDQGLLRYVNYDNSAKTLKIKCDFLRRNFLCVGCLPIAWLIQKKIADELIKFDAIKSVEFLL